MTPRRTIAWFSAGVSSAVATKLLVDAIDQIIYTHIDDQHPDTMRFVQDCEKWFGKRITVLQSPYKCVETACRMSGGRGYINGAGGAACSLRLKRRIRMEWEMEQREPLRYVWGMDVAEQNRCDRIREAMASMEHVFPLVDKRMTKEDAHRVLHASGIKRPAMYDLGYNNNNCVGCVKGGMGYWNHIRVDFPAVFTARAMMEREIVATCIKGVYLDELDPKRGANRRPIVEDCGMFCGILALAGKEVPHDPA